MKSTRLPKSKRQTGRNARLGFSKGIDSASISPPGYGVDFVDHGHAATAPVQLQGDLEEEELLQGASTVQRQDELEEKELLQGKFATTVAPMQFETGGENAENHTGMPDQLMAGLEQLGGIDLSGVRVHYNSSKPAQLNALAYTQGEDIHIGPRQEKHLPHEGWHVVQQMQGRVKPTMQAKDISINDEAGLEREADVMGDQALRLTRSEQVAMPSRSSASTSLRQKRSASFSPRPVPFGRKSPAGASPIQRILLKPGEDEGSYVAAAEGEEGAFEFNTQSPERRNVIAKSVQSDKALYRRISRDYRAKRLVAKPERAPESAGELLALGARIEALRSYRKVKPEDVNELVDLVTPEAEDDPVIRDIKAALFTQLLSIPKVKGAVEGLDVGREPVTAADIAAYKNDIVEMGVWGGPGEADTLGVQHNIRFDIWTIDHLGRFRRVYPNLGQGNPTGRDLVHIGNHYVVIETERLQEGAQAPEPLRVVAKTEELGDCLFEGFYIVEHGAKPADYAGAIAALRAEAQGHITDVAVETAVELIRSGSRAGLGTRMKGMLGNRYVAARGTGLIDRATELLKTDLEDWEEGPLRIAKEAADAALLEDQRAGEEAAEQTEFSSKTVIAMQNLEYALEQFAAPQATGGSSAFADLVASNAETVLGEYVYSSQVDADLATARGHVGTQVKKGKKDQENHTIAVGDLTGLIAGVQAAHLTGGGTTYETEWARHDIQNPDTNVFFNYQIQMGGTKMRPKLRKTSWTAVLVDARVVNGHEAAVLPMILNAHRQSYNQSRKFIISLDDKAGRTFIAGKKK